MPLEFKIGMVAPSRAGKTSLMAAMFYEMRQRLTGNAQGIEYYADGHDTREAINKSLSVFQACVDSRNDIFAVPNMTNTQDFSNFKFVVGIPVSGEISQIKIDIMDYPGGLLGDIKFAQTVMPHLRDSHALLVPIPADVLMEWKRTHGNSDPHSININSIAHHMLCVRDVLNVIKTWLHGKVRRREKAMLFFVPIRCETYFDDNCGQNDQSSALHEAVKELYVDPLRITTLRIEEKDARSFIQVETHAVDTYGIVELRDIVVNSGVLVSTFRKRIGQGNEIRSRGALEILAEIIDFRLRSRVAALNIRQRDIQATIDGRGFWASLGAYLFGDKAQQGLNAIIGISQADYQAMAAIVNLRQEYPTRQKIYNEIGD